MTLAHTLASEPDGRAVLRIRGELDPDNAERFRNTLITTHRRHPRLAIDLHDAVILKPSGIQALHALAREARARGRALPALRAVRPSAANALKLAGLNNVFPLEPAPGHPRHNTAADRGGLTGGPPKSWQSLRLLRQWILLG